MRSQEEFRLACFVADTLRRFARPGVVWFHVPNGENRSAITGARLKRMGVRPGVADFIFFFDRTYGDLDVAFLELKSSRGRLSPQQKAFESAVLRLGCRYGVARSGAEAVSTLTDWGILANTVRVAA